MPNTALDAALARIAGEPAVATGGAGAVPAPKQSFSDFLNPYMTESKTMQRTPNFDPMAQEAVSFQSAITAPLVAPVATAPAPAAPPLAASNEPSMISRADLYQRMSDEQNARHQAMSNAQMANWTPQQRAGFNPPVYYNKPADWGGLSGANQMINNPYKGNV